MTNKLKEDWSKQGGSFGNQTREWKAIQSMDKGSVFGTRAEAKKKQAYLMAVYNYRKKYGQDLLKARKAVEKINQFLVQLKESEELNEERLDELSKKTLGSYIRKASSSAVDNATKMGKAEMEGKSGSSDRLSSKIYKRKDGIKTAVKKLTKESEELNENNDPMVKRALRDYLYYKNLPSKKLLDELKSSSKISSASSIADAGGKSSAISSIMHAEYGEKTFKAALKLHKQGITESEVYQVKTAPGAKIIKLPIAIGKDASDVEENPVIKKHGNQDMLDEAKQLPLFKKVDMMGKKCKKCKKGTYKERSQHDDYQGTVTCECGHSVKRDLEESISEAVMSYKDWLAREKAAKAKGTVSKETKAYSGEKTKSDFTKDAPAKTPARSKKLGDPAKLNAVRAKLKKQGIETSLKGITLYYKGSDKNGAKIRSALRHAGISLPVKAFLG